MSELTKGLLLMFLSTISFSAMTCMVKIVSDCNVYTTTTVRFAIGIIVVVMLVVSGRGRLSNIDKKGLFLRGLLGGVSILICFFSIANLGIVKASILLNTYPVFATIFGVMILKERISIVKIGAMIIAFLALVFIILEKSSPGEISLSVGFYELLSIAGAVISGYAIVLIKKIRKTETTSSIFLAQCVVGLFIAVIPSVNGAADLQTGAVVIMILAGLFAAGGQLLSTEAYVYIEAGTGSVFGLIAPVINCIAGMVFFHEALTIQALAGGFVVLSASAILVMPQEYLKKIQIPDRLIESVVNKKTTSPVS